MTPDRGRVPCVHTADPCNTVRRLRDLGRASAAHRLDENLVAVGARPTLDPATFARPSVELRAEDGGTSPWPA